MLEFRLVFLCGVCTREILNTDIFVLVETVFGLGWVFVCTGKNYKIPGTRCIVLQILFSEFLNFSVVYPLGSPISTGFLCTSCTRDLSVLIWKFGFGAGIFCRDNFSVVDIFSVIENIAVPCGILSVAVMGTIGVRVWHTRANL